jgi:hypothetical protein
VAFAGLFAVASVVVQRGDDLVEVVGDLTVHLDQPGLAACFGGGDDLQDLVAVLAVLGQELGGGEEHRAGETGFSELNDQGGFCDCRCPDVCNTARSSSWML